MFDKNNIAMLDQTSLKNDPLNKLEYLEYSFLIGKTTKRQFLNNVSRTIRRLV
jgi:hypothetical protein